MDKSVEVRDNLYKAVREYIENDPHLQPQDVIDELSNMVTDAYFLEQDIQHDIDDYLRDSVLEAVDNALWHHCEGRLSAAFLDRVAESAGFNKAVDILGNTIMKVARESSE